MFKKLIERITHRQAKRTNLKKLAVKLQAAAEAQGYPSFQIAAAKVAGGLDSLRTVEAIDLANNALSRDSYTARYKLSWNGTSVVVHRR